MVPTRASVLLGMAVVVLAAWWIGQDMLWAGIVVAIVGLAATYVRGAAGTVVGVALAGMFALHWLVPFFAFSVFGAGATAVWAGRQGFDGRIDSGGF